jgi:hypothetical protein
LLWLVNGWIVTWIHVYTIHVLYTVLASRAIYSVYRGLYPGGYSNNTGDCSNLPLQVKAIIK